MWYFQYFATEQKCPSCIDSIFVLFSDALSSGLSALYAKIIVIIGIALPVTEVLTSRIPSMVYQSFYVYLYVVSILFVIFVYTVHMKTRAVFSLIKTYRKCYFCNGFPTLDDKYWRLDAFQMKKPIMIIRWKRGQRTLDHFIYVLAPFHLASELWFILGWNLDNTLIVSLLRLVCYTSIICALFTPLMLLRRKNCCSIEILTFQWKLFVV